MMGQKLLPVTLVAALLAMLATWLLFRNRELHILPSEQPAFKLFTYTDVSDSGKSISEANIQSNRLVMRYTLQPGFAYPYVGVGMDFLRKDSISGETAFLNLAQYDSIRIKMRSTISNEVRIQIVTHDPNLSRPDAPLSMRHLVQTTSVERGWTTKSLWLGSFTIPEWWYQLNHLQPDPGNRLLDRTAHIDFQNGQRTPLEIPDTLEIAEIVFVGENRALGWILSSMALVLVFAFGIHSWSSRERMRAEHGAQIAHRREELLGKAEKLPLSSHRTDDSKRILDYVGKHYSDSELDLERVCRETGVNRNRLSAILKEEVGATFKGHLTDLRLSEATRVLSETDLQVTEIAYKVGFGNVSHFNRVFKEHFDITPNEFRRNNKQAPPHV